jgi:prevent-host-death family protein
MKTVSYSDARQNLSQLCTQVAEQDETIIITRRDKQDVVMLSMEKYSKFMRIFNDMTNNLQIGASGDKLYATADLPCNESEEPAYGRSHSH